MSQEEKYLTTDDTDDTDDTDLLGISDISVISGEKLFVCYRGLAFFVRHSKYSVPSEAGLPV
jgi:hypothetical protein